MIDLACIFTTGGVILFLKTFCSLKFDVIDALIKKVLIQDKIGDNQFQIDPYVIKWRFANDLGLIFVVVYQELFQLQYVEDLLEKIKENYINTMYSQIEFKDNLVIKIPQYDDQFNQVQQMWYLKQQKLDKKASIMRSYDQTAKGKEQLKKKGESNTQSTNKSEQSKDSNKNLHKNSQSQEKITSEDDTQAQRAKSSDNSNQISQDEILKNRQNLLQRFQKKDQKSFSEIKETQVQSEKSKGKEDRNWGFKSSISSQDMKKLDVTAKLGKQEDQQKINSQFFGDDEETKKMMAQFYDDDLEFSDDDEVEEQQIQTKSSRFGGIFNKLTSGIKNITGNKIITDEEISAIMEKFREDLMAKNVAEEISQKLCQSIKASLIDKKTKAFTSLSKTIKIAMAESLTNILTSKKQIDMIRDAQRARERGKPYVAVFIGVNGVGKSTNLAKVAYLFKTQGFKVMLAACDNFRAGAVEQIQTHGRNLGIPVYERGYKEKPAVIAQLAIKEAIVQQQEVVLIDTAGRMQDNEPLMKELSMLVQVNQPDLVIFIGEALVGNDGVDQLMKFNKALIDLSPKDNIRQIDGIILSKFDTVDDKVGAAISMTYSTGKPIIFVGVGQKYPHLRKLNVKTVVNALLA